MEATHAVLITFGLATLLVSWVLLLIASWKEDFLWGLCALILPPLAYAYGLFRLDKAGASVGLAGIGLVLIWMS